MVIRSGYEIEVARERQHRADGIEKMLAALDAETRTEMLALVPGLTASLEHLFEGGDDILIALVAETLVSVLSQVRLATIDDVSDLLRHTSGAYAIVAGIKRGAYTLPDDVGVADEAKLAERFGPYL